MRAFSIIFNQPFVKVSLQLFKCRIDFLPECHLVKLIEYVFEKSLNDPIGLWVSRFGFRVIDVIECQV